MYQNLLSKKTKKQNHVRIKTKSFKTNLKQSYHRVENKSSQHNLAGNLYSTKYTYQMSPKKIVARSTSLSQITFQNPEKFFNNSQIKGLNTRASHISNFSDINTQLILQKRSLQQKIAFLNEEIARQKKLFAKAQIHCKKNEYQLQKSNNSIKQLRIRSQRLNDGITEAKHDCNVLRRNLSELRADNQQTMKQKDRQKHNCDSTQEECRRLKGNLLDQDRFRGNLKQKLIEKQVQMNKRSIYLKQDQQERANLLLQINNFFLVNKRD